MTDLNRIELSREALTHNLRAFRGLVPSGTALIAVVKGNAYGHGLGEVVEAIEEGVDGFQVDDLLELRALRQVTEKRALVLGYVARHEVEEAVALGGELTLYDEERLPILDQAAERCGRDAAVHLKIDALLGRQGVLPEAIDAFGAHLLRYPRIRVVGTYAHYANIEDTTDLVHAEAQTALLHEAHRQVVRRLPPHGRHLAATSGLMTLPDPEATLVRVGIGLYGMYPSAALARTHAGLDLRPAMRWVSHLAQVKTLPAGHPVGYGLTYLCRGDTRVGIVPQGYSDGYDRGLSNCGEVLVHGRRCPVIGRIAMNMFAVDLSGVPEARPEDEVVLLGTQGDERISAEEIAARIGTINYEVTTRVSALLPRIVV